MRQLIPLLLVCLPVLAFSQKNIVKVNLSSLTMKNYHVTYERQLAKRLSISLGVRHMPKGNLPYQSSLEDQLIFDDDDFNIGLFQIGNTAITPEVRLYLGKRSMRGFYIAPYARWASFDMNLPVQYESTTIAGTVKKDAVFTGKITSFSGGLMFGTQHTLGKRIVLDIWIVGGHYGTSNGDLNVTFNPPLNAQERQALQDNLNEFDPSPFKFSSSVATNGSSARVESTGPWAGVRALGINLGFRF